MKKNPAPIPAEKKATVRVMRAGLAAKPLPKSTAAAVEAPPAPLKARRAPVKKLKEKIVSAFKKVKRSMTRTATVRRKKNKIPPLLLEGDQPALPPASGPGRKYALG